MADLQGFEEIGSFEELTEEKIVQEENELQNLEVTILAKKFPSPLERESTLQEFYSLAEQLRSLHQLARSSIAQQERSGR